MSESFDVLAGDGVKIRITGLNATLRAMSRAGASSEDMRDVMHSLGMIVVRAARPPRSTGRLAATVRPGRGKTKAVVRAGRKTVPYAGVQHYGWPARNIPATQFLTEALNATRPQVITALDKGITDILKKENLL